MQEVMEKRNDELQAEESADGPASPAEAAEIGENLPAEPVDSALARITAERDEMKDKYLRLAAEYDNFRRRSLKERSELAERAQAELLVKLLDALDDLDRVIEGGEKIASVADLLQAVQVTDKKLWKELEKAGLEFVDPSGVPFDPAVHEAVSQIPAPEEALAGQVAAAFQVGYRFKGILLRPARVQVYGDPA